MFITFGQPSLCFIKNGSRDIPRFAEMCHIPILLFVQTSYEVRESSSAERQLNSMNFGQNCNLLLIDTKPHIYTYKLILRRGWRTRWPTSRCSSTISLRSIRKWWTSLKSTSTIWNLYTPTLLKAQSRGAAKSLGPSSLLIRVLSVIGFNSSKEIDNNSTLKCP